jgi:cell division protein FtsW (lipid II flippase)
LELGYGGLLFFLFLFYRLFVLNKIFFSAIDDPFWKAISIGFFGILFTSAYAIVYNLSWISPPLGFPLWFIAGAIYRVGYLKGIYLKCCSNQITKSLRAA